MSKLKKFIILAGDVLILYLSLGITLAFRYGSSGFAESYASHLVPFSTIFIAWILVFYSFNLYQYKISKTANLLRDVFLGVFTSGVVSIIAFYLFPDFFQLTPKTNLVIFGVVVFILKNFWQRLLIFKIFATGAEKIIIVGNSPLISKTALHLKDNPHLGYSVEAWFDDPALVDFQMLLDKIHKTGTRLIVIQNHLTKKAQVSNLIYKLLTYEVNVINFWSFYELVFDRVPIEELEEGWFIENVTSHMPFYDVTKRMIDITISAAMILFFSPLLLLIATVTKLSSKEPVIYKQKRVGKNDNVFTLYKFRTMNNGKDGPLWTEKNDRRLTGIGKILRLTHLDELPQLINILNGDISLTGPRPERVELVDKYKHLPHYEIRHIIKPGVTGWAQINYKPSASVEEAREKLCYDIYYIKNRSIFLDFVIILRTIRYLFTSNE